MTDVGQLVILPWDHAEIRLDAPRGLVHPVSIGSLMKFWTPDP